MNSVASPENQTFPRITSKIVEVDNGFIVTVWFRKSPGVGNAGLLTDESVDSIETARAIIGGLARKHGISSEYVDIEIDMHDFLPPDENRH